MHFSPSNTWKLISWKTIVSALFLVAALTASLAVPTPHGTLYAQPALVQLAQQHPNTTLSLIVQKTARDRSVESLVCALGGRIVLDLPIINAFSAELPAGALPSLAQAAGVRWVSLDGPMISSTCAQCIDTSKLKNVYDRAIGADRVWNESPYLQGQGIGVAVLDSGVNPQQDLYTLMGVNRLVAAVAFNGGYNQSVYDGFGHGNHIAGIIGGNGSRSNGAYIGVAPMVNLINVKVSDDDGATRASNLVKGLQWVLNNKDRYNIRVVNISMNNAVAESYHTSPIDAAVEILWFNKIVVVASAGNRGSGALYPPANDPFIITVGAVDDQGTPSIADDKLASFSGFGKTVDGFAKPDLVAPGTNIVSLMANPNSVLAGAHPGNVVDRLYFRMSGTSVAAPIVSGAAALLLQDEPALNPDQVKYRLKATANKNWAGYDGAKAGAGYLNIYAAVHGMTTAAANTGTAASQLLWTGSNPPAWGSVYWNSVYWNSVYWNSVYWNSVYWNSVYWNSDYWE